MGRPKKGYSLGADPSHQQLMLRNLARSLFEHERVRTTEAKARALRPFAERLITKAKKGTIHHRRQALSVIQDREVVHKLFADIGPRFAARNGGYTRVLKLDRREGDGAPMALVELLDAGAAPTGRGSESQQEPARRRLRRPGRRRAGAAQEAAPGAAPEEAGQAQAEAEAPASDAEAEGAAPEAEGPDGPPA